MQVVASLFAGYSQSGINISPFPVINKAVSTEVPRFENKTRFGPIDGRTDPHIEMRVASKKKGNGGTRR